MLNRDRLRRASDGHHPWAAPSRTQVRHVVLQSRRRAGWNQADGGGRRAEKLGLNAARSNQGPCGTTRRDPSASAPSPRRQITTGRHVTAASAKGRRPELELNDGPGASAKSCALWAPALLSGHPSLWFMAPELAAREIDDGYLQLRLGCLSSRSRAALIGATAARPFASNPVTCGVQPSSHPPSDIQHRLEAVDAPVTDSRQQEAGGCPS